PADILERFDRLRFEGEGLAFVRRAAREGWGETARDLASHRTFRTDIFARGAPSLTARQVDARLGALMVEPWPPRLAIERGTDLAAGAALAPEVERKAADLLARGAQTIAEFAAAMDLPGRQGGQTALILLARGDLRVVRSPDDPDADPAHIAGMQRALAERYREGVAVPAVASPRLGAAIPLAPEDLAGLFEGSVDPGSEIARGLARLGLEPGA
ncbi:MAG: hypothetical protein AAF908_07010, partial [Pseudomonadota bacterium]